MQFSPVAYHFHPLRGKYLFTTLFSNIPQSYLSESNHISQPHRATRKIIILYSSAFTFFWTRNRTRGSEMDSNMHLPNLLCTTLFMQLSYPTGKTHDNTSSMTTSFCILCNLLCSDHTLFNLLFTKRPIIGCITTNSFQSGIK